MQVFPLLFCSFVSPEPKFRPVSAISSYLRSSVEKFIFVLYCTIFKLNFKIEHNPRESWTHLLVSAPATSYAAHIVHLIRPGVVAYQRAHALARGI